ncbi:hypothetical protein [Kitasatospora purpeofusca]|uniref:Zinc ribbon domain-containing protein n=1 Tax=Kitasatospora purpeofusca TaxID=67352 RepID=A0ABZ1UAD9_9ACTN|nr:hypothetical protein [Kitasatospora purpeofusca]
MICPHCSKNLLQRERTKRRCSFCRKEFALDPKLDGLGLHDVRIRKVTEKLSDQGRLTVTDGQLAYALQHRGRPPQQFRGDKNKATGLLLPGLIGLLFSLAVLDSGFGPLVLLVALLLIGLSIRQFALVGVPAPDTSVHSRWTEDAFRTTVLDRWRTTYGALPPGLVDGRLVPPGPPPAAPALALLCPDRTITAFLRANGYAERHRALLVHDLREVPAGLPLVVLHDASPQGHLLAADARAARPGLRVLDAGLSVRTVLVDQTKYTLLRDLYRPEELYVRLQRAVPELTGSQRAWFAEGWWTPLAALAPKRLLAIADRAAERIIAPPSPRAPAARRTGPVRSPAVGRPENPLETRRRALAVGFMSWPEPEADGAPGGAGGARPDGPDLGKGPA